MRPAAALLVAVGITVGACSADRPVLTSETIPPPSTSTSTTTSTTTMPPVEPTAAPDGRVYPGVGTDPTAVAARLTEVERSLRALPPDEPGWDDLAHEQQVIYRHLGRDETWAAAVVDRVADELIATVEAHVAARRAIGRIGDGDPPRNVPAWEIVDPLPAADLRAIYRAAEAATGIDWAYLAAINLLETGYGRIDGLSTAGAQGPMQFLPTTWEEVGEGSIDDPRDAIPAAARYLVRRGGPDDMDGALWGYNNSDAYVEAVSIYAELFRLDERAFVHTHGWEIHYSAAIGDLWFPVGYRRDESVPAEVHVAEAPWSTPPPAGASG